MSDAELAFHPRGRRSKCAWRLVVSFLYGTSPLALAGKPRNPALMSPAPTPRLECDRIVQGRLLEDVDGRPAAQDNCGRPTDGTGEGDAGPSPRGKDRQLPPSTDTTSDR